MKRIFSFVAACATMFALAACQEELQQPVEEQKPVLEGIEGELQEVTFTVTTPADAQTKAISDGLKATELEYAVYRAEAYVAEDGTEYPAGEYIPVLSQGQNAKIEKNGERNWTVTLTLAKNVKYDVVFWAYAKNAPYTFDEENAKIVVNNYTDAANDEVRDAFFGRCDEYAVVTTDTKVKLRRPFAQINFAADDYVPYVTDLHLDVTSKIDTDYHAAEEATAYEVARPAVAQTLLPTVLNVLDGTVGEPKVVDFALGQIPYNTGDQVLLEVDNGSGEKKPYYWVSMNYVLAAEDENTIDNIRATFNYNGENLKIDVPNVPYKRNYKTNILGTLFTGPARFNVVICPDYYTPDTIINLWDGVTVTEPMVEGDEYVITTGAELAWVANQVNSGKNDFAGKKVLIASDIRLANFEWTPIGTDEHPFSGSIEALAVTSLLTKSAAEYYTISGLYVNETEGPAGLVGVLKGGEVINLSLVEPNVNGESFVGAVVGKIFPEGLVEGVTVIGGQVNGNHFVGGLVGHAYGSVKKSVVDGTVVTGTPVKDNEDLDGDKVGGVIGYHAPDADGTEVSDNVVKNVTVSAKRDAGLVAGAANANNVFGNKVESGAVEATGNNVDVVVGRVLEGTLDPMANEYNYENITVNGVQAAAPAYVFTATADEQAIPAKGGSYTIAVAGNVAWTVVVPEGLAATPAKGKGPADVVVAVPENTLYEAVSYVVKVATEAAVEKAEYTFTIQQEAAEKPAPVGPVKATVAEFLAAEVGEIEYQLTGVIEGTYNTTYGNFYLNDGTEKVLVYGLTATKQESNDKSFASLGLRDGDELTLIGTRADYQGSAQVGGPAYYVSHVAAPFLDLANTTATVDAEMTEYKIALESNTTWTAVASEGVTLDKAAGEGNAEVTMTFAANTTNEAVAHTVTFTYGEKTATFTLTQKGVPAEGGEEIVGGGSDDFNTISSTNTSYVSGKTTAGWNYANCAIFKGGTSDSSPAFKMIGDASNRALCMNGKTSAVGKITSPTLNGGCGTLTFDYGLPFSDTKIKFRVDIVQNGETVKTFTINNASATKLTKYSHEEVVDIAGDFQIVFTNLSPSNNTGNKDRTAIWNVEWTGCAK